MSMRTYGRLLKNIAAIALLLALLSMLLPFCKFSAGGQEMTLSGLDVVKAFFDKFLSTVRITKE